MYSIITLQQHNYTDDGKFCGHFGWGFQYSVYIIYVYIYGCTANRERELSSPAPSDTVQYSCQTVHTHTYIYILYALKANVQVCIVKFWIKKNTDIASNTLKLFFLSKLAYTIYK